MNEIFGEENVLGVFVWKRRTGSNDAQDNFSIDHEYVLVARRSTEYEFGGVSKHFDNYKNPDRDPRGAWTNSDLTCNKTNLQRPNLFYPLTNPKTGIVYPCNPNRVWAYKQDRMAQIVAADKIVWPRDPSGTPQYKRHLSEVKSKTKPVSTWIEASTRKSRDIQEEEEADQVTILQSGLTQQGTKDFRSLFGEAVFDYPKPVSLITALVEQATIDDPSGEGDIILDFFAGSGTTAEAVLN